MTYQIKDTLRYRRTSYDIYCWSAPDPVPLAALGEKPAMASTACWRGNMAKYALKRSRLMLENWFVNLIDTSPSIGKWLDRRGPIFNGISPIKPDGFFNNHYAALNLEIDYTGGVLLVNQNLSDEYGHPDFPSLWYYKSVIELDFEQGVLRNRFNRSRQMAEIRTFERRIDRMKDKTFKHKYWDITDFY